MRFAARLSGSVAALLPALEQSPEPVFVTDRQNRIVFWNKSAERLLGYTADETLGAPCAGMLEGCDPFGNRYCSDTCPITQTAVRHESVRHFGLTLKAKDGAEVTVDVSVLTFTGASPDAFYLAHILQPADKEKRREPGAEAPAPPRPNLVSIRESPDARARKLTSREVEVLAMLAAGRTTPEIAEGLHISHLTARNHIQNILEKLEVHSKAEAVAFAFQKQIV